MIPELPPRIAALTLIREVGILLFKARDGRLAAFDYTYERRTLTDVEASVVVMGRKITVRTPERTNLVKFEGEGWLLDLYWGGPDSADVIPLHLEGDQDLCINDLFALRMCL